MKLITLLLLMAISGVQAWACSEDGKGGFLPENDLFIPANTKSTPTGISAEKFNEVIDKVETIYGPIASSFGGQLNIARLWENGTVNAAAYPSGNEMNVLMYGGLARHPAITEDGFALVLCHEIGHHIGGAPKKVMGWASNEGQADYFATLKCLRKVFALENNEAALKKMLVPIRVTVSCSRQFKNKLDRQICARSAMAGMSVSKLFQSLRGQEKAPNFTTPDTAKVASTFDGHPAYQCRLDTYFQGALCLVDENTDVSQKEEVTGTCHPSLGDKVGLRPTCWMKYKE
jgi:hypothetical protein